MKAPLVSVCVPNLNTRPFLPERFETIFAQTFQDWELLAYDSYSEDGAWQYIQELAEREPRLRAWQGPREGTPGSWNPCIREARGQYVYIATSDDTMPPDCLEKLVTALEGNPDCDIAHCKLRKIDENGRDLGDWWHTETLFAHSSGELMELPHIRRAPFDGLLHLLGATVYTSITQLLVRRCLFDRIGMFESKWGAAGDFHWGMRAGLAANTVHVPDTWGGWRIHGSQATSFTAAGSGEAAKKIQGMIEDAITEFEKSIPTRLRKPLARTKELGILIAQIAARDNWSDRQKCVLRGLFTGSAAARGYIKAKLGLAGSRQWPEAATDLTRQWLEDAGVGSVLVPLRK